ncbi:hypothetical protein ACHAWF_012696 [Thalassiosira exigua]
MLPIWTLGAQEDVAAISLAFILSALLVFFAGPSFKKWAPRLRARGKKRSPPRRQMTPIGKFALLSQTERNPSIICFFIAIANRDEGMKIDEFEQLWSTVMKEHERFRLHVCDPNCFEESNKPIDQYTLEVPHPENPDEFRERIDSFLLSPMDVTDQPWEICLSSGPIGSSGAILNSKELIQEGYKTETVALFRVHHVICDGVSISAAVKDISDEKDKLDGLMLDAVEKYKAQARKMGLVQKVLGLVMYYVFGSIYALSLQAWNMMTSTPNPFDQFINDKENKSKRSVSWKYLASIEEAKSVARMISRRTKLNDLFAALLSSALERQYKDLNAKSETPKTSSKCPSSVNVVVPVHLQGSVLPGQQIGNKIGAFVQAIPFNASPGAKLTSSLSRVRTISKTINKMKRTPAPLISWLLTACISYLGIESIAKDAIVRANCHATAVLSNVHGYPFEIHWKGRPIKMLCAFLPLPPKVPIGILVTSYDGMIIMSVEADYELIPDPDQFLDYMLEEYEEIKKELSFKLGQ